MQLNMNTFIVGYQDKLSKNFYIWIFPVLISVSFLLVHQHNALLFHSLIEIFAIFVAFITFVIVWSTYSFSRNNYMLVIGIFYFWIASLDLMHVLTYKGFDFFSHTGVTASTQYWIAARFVEALALLIATIALKKLVISRWALFGVVAVVSITTAFTIQYGYFPVTFIDGQGLTPFKVNMEYIIMSLLVLAGFFLWKHKNELNKTIWHLMLLSIILTIGAEYSFTLYKNIGEFVLILGHQLKFISFWFIFYAVTQTSLTEPFNIMAQDTTTYNALPDPIVVVDTNGYIKQANQASLSLFLR